MTEGPSKIPPMTSAITRGWRIRDNGKWSKRQKTIIMKAWHCKLQFESEIPQEKGGNTNLNYKKGEWVRWTVLRRIQPVEDPALGGNLRGFRGGRGLADRGS